jgi:hypothetical protein
MTTATTLDLLARPNTYKHFVAAALLKSNGKTLTFDQLSKAAYGEVKDEYKAPIAMILVGIKVAIKANKLPLQVVREKGTVKIAPKGRSR